VALATRNTRQTKLYQGGHNDAEYSLEKLAGLGIKSGLALPLVNNDRFYGVLTVFSSTSEAFDAVEVKLMEELAGDIAYGIVTLRARC
jgi:GAF domain-containing protein